MIPVAGSYGHQVAICSLSKVESEINRDQMDRVNQLRIINLTRNESGTFSVNYETIPLPTQSWKEKISLLKVHFYQNIALYQKCKKALVQFAFFLGVTIVVWAIAVSIINRYLADLKQDILLGRLHYTKYPYGKVEMDQYYTEQAMFLWMPSASAVLVLTVLAALEYGEDAANFKASLIDFFKDPTRLLAHVDPKEGSSEPVELSNDTRDGLVSDPISGQEIKEEWIHAPRFIKIGKYAYSLETLIKRFFTTSLDENEQIKNPLGNWHITKDEQEKLRKDLCDLLLLDSQDLEKYWDPYFCDARKVYLTLDKHPRLEAATKEDRPAVMQDILFEQDLSHMVPNWNTYNPDQQASIKQQSAPDYFADQRIIRFLSEFDEEVLSLEIKLNNTESFKLQDLLNESKNKEYRFG